MRNLFQTRALMIRRIIVGTIIALPIISMIMGAFVLWGLPELARDRVIEAIRNRTGLETTIGSVSIGLSTVSLQGVKIIEPTMKGILIESPEIKVGADLLDVIMHGLGGLNSIGPLPTA